MTDSTTRGAIWQRRQLGEPQLTGERLAFSDNIADRMWLASALPTRASTRAAAAFGNRPAAGRAARCGVGCNCCWTAVVLG